MLKSFYYWLASPVMWRIQEVKDQQSYLIDRMDVLNSSLWDENYYFRNYQKDILDSKLSPVDHFLQIGWKKGCNPSSHFDCQDYLNRCSYASGNPLLFFIRSGRYRGKEHGFSHNTYPIDSKHIESYLEQKKNRKTTKVAYTCITNDYDDLNQIIGYTYFDDSWDYVCFSDNEELISKKRLGIWEIRPLYNNTLESSLGNRFHKILPHIVLPEYTESLYIDANINILTPYIFEQIESLKQDLIFPVHSCFSSVYQEYQWIVSKRLDRIEELVDLVRKAGFPEDYGFCENNIIYRKHQKTDIIDIMNEWWEYVRDYCRRDQASLTYVLWKHHIKLDSSMTINNSKIDYQNFCRFDHVKSWDY